MSPFDSYLVQRGLYTLGPESNYLENAHKLAEYLEVLNILNKWDIQG